MVYCSIRQARAGALLEMYRNAQSLLKRLPVSQPANAVPPKFKRVYESVESGADHVPAEQY